MKPFEIFSTTADVGLKIRGKTFGELYANAVTGFYTLVFGYNKIPERAGHAAVVRFQYRGDSCENVLVNLLSELIFLLYAEHRISSGMDIKTADTYRLDADLFIQKIAGEPEIEIKSVTYHNLSIRSIKGIKSAKIIFDI